MAADKIITEGGPDTIAREVSAGRAEQFPMLDRALNMAFDEYPQADLTRLATPDEVVVFVRIMMRNNRELAHGIEQLIYIRPEEVPARAQAILIERGARIHAPPAPARPT